VGRVTATLPAPTWPDAPARGRGAVLATLAVLTAVLLAGSAIGLATSTETRYAEIGREMQATGDLVVPRLNGAPHLEKPPWTYWALAAAYAVAGANDLAARLPGLLAGALTLLVVAGVVRRHAPASDPDPRGRGRGAVLVLATMPALLAQAFTVSTDAWLVLASTAAGAAVLESARCGGRPPLRWVLALHAAIGVGVLAKGPAVLVTPLAGALATAVVRRDAAVLRPFAHPAGLLLLVAVGLPWFLVADARLPGLLDLYVTRRLVGGVASAAEFHAEHGPLVVWAPVLLGTAPWVGGAFGAWTALARDGARRGPLVPLVAMALATPVFFSFSASRLVSYASPAVPWVAALVAAGAPVPGAADDLAALRFRRHLARATLVTALVVLGLPVAVLAVPGGAPGWLGTAAAVLAALAAAAAVARRAPQRALVVATALVVGLAATVATHRERLGAHRPVADALEARRAPGEAVGVAIHKDGDWGLLPFYLGETVRFFGYEARLSTRPPEAFSPEGFRPLDELRAWWTSPGRRWLLVRARVGDPRNDVRRRLDGTTVVEVARYGRYALLTNRE
jgi:4-amino-4-deoxy-L-arabinose transferase-like glycosyltransferase